MNQHYWIVTTMLAIMIIFTRGLPFMMGNLMSKRLNYLGKLLPAYIMMLLVIYEINVKTVMIPPYGMPALVALGVLTLVHLWLRNTFLTLFVGTTIYLLVNYYLVG